MHQAANRTKPYPENPVRTSPAYLRNTTHTTGVMLVFGIVQALLRDVAGLAGSVHSVSFSQFNSVASERLTL
jgi:hypothetical protein